MKRIFVVGSLNVDMVFCLQALPRQGETVKSRQWLLNCGGKGANQAVTCGKQDADVFMVGSVGEDGFARQLLTSLANAGVNTDFVRTVPVASTGLAVILLQDGDNRIILGEGANALTRPEQVREALEAKARPGDILLVQLEIPLETVRYALSLAKMMGLSTVLNPAPALAVDDSLLRWVDWIIPNEIEAETLSGIPRTEPDFLSRAVTFFRTRGVGEVVVTLGENGAFYGNGNDLLAVPSYEIACVDTTAAGDAFVGTLVTGLAKGFSAEKILPRANAAGALTVSRPGAQSSIPTSIEIDKFLEKARPRATRKG